MKHINNNLVKRFLSKVQITQYCWIWKGGKFESGYGYFNYNYKLVRSHRMSYMLFKGKIPEELQLDHLCRNKLCVNPQHLEAVTQRINNLRSNSFSGVNARKTHCKRGHKLSGSNLLINKKGFRNCRKCELMWDRNHPRIR